MTSTPAHAPEHHEYPCTHDLFLVPKAVSFHIMYQIWQPLKVDLHSLRPQCIFTGQRLWIRVTGMPVMESLLRSSVVQRSDILMIKHVSKMVGDHGIVRW